MPPSTSAPCRLENISWRGFDALLLDNDLIRAVVVPSLGGKIASLVHLRSGREWLWRNPHLEPRRPEFGDSYVERFDLGGFDECFPSVARTHFPSGPWEGTPVPDHGELWALPWKTESYCDGTQIDLRMAVHGVRFPYRFERALFVAEGEARIRLAYTLTNLTPMEFPFIWSAHPVFHVTPGTRLVAPMREMTVYSSQKDRFGRLGATVQWPELTDREGRSYDFSTLPEPEADLALKVYGKAPSQGYVALVDPVLGAELRLQFDPEEITHMAMWLNFGGWAGAPGAQPYYNLALEPCIGAQDDLAVAVKQLKEHGTLPPNGRRTWQLDVILR